MNFIIRTLSATALLAFALTLAGCGASRTTAQTQSAPPAPKAAADDASEAGIMYNYLVYQDLLLRIQHLSMNRTGLNAEKIIELRNQAAEHLEKVLRYKPEARLYLELASLYWSEGDGGAKARDLLEEGLAKFPEDRLLTVYLANAWLQAGQPEKGAQIMTAYITKHPEDHEARARLAALLEEEGNWAQALDELKRIPASELNPEILYLRARAKARLGHRKLAIADLERATKEDPEFFDAFAELAYQYEMEKDYEAAERTYHVMLSMGAATEQIMLRIVNMNLKLNDADKALEQALQGPKTKGFLLDTAMLFIENGFYAQASTVLDALASTNNTPPEYWFYKAVIAHEGEKDSAKALSYLGKVTPTSKFYPNSLQFRAQILDSLNLTDRALEVLREGRSLYPQSDVFYINEAGMLFRAKRGAEALEVLDEGLKSRPDDAELAYEKGMLLESMDRREEALKVMEAILTKHPDNAKVLNYVGYTLAEEGRELARAKVLVSNALRLDPENGFIIDSMAWVHYRLKEYKEAWAAIQTAVQYVDGQADIWEHYGDIAAAVGDKKEARKGYQNAIDAGHANPDGIKAKMNKL